jgi:hypothetical protein
MRVFIVSAHQAPAAGVTHRVRGIVMKSYTTRILALAGVAFVLTAGVAKAQSGTDTISKVPFTFNVGASVMPPDTYRVSEVGGNTGVFMISSFRHSAIVLSQPDGRTADDSPRLVFHRYGDSYFLREVRMAGDTGFRLPESRQERDAQERIAARSTPERIVVLANQK